MLSKYIESFKKIKTDINRTRWFSNTKYRAPYKPLLLLTIFDLISQGEIKNNLIELTPEFCETFSLYWFRLMPPERKGNIAMPFFYLTSDGFWHLIPYPRKEKELETITERNIHLTTVNQIKEVAIGAKFDDELFELLKIEENRNRLGVILITTFFAPEAASVLLEQSQINVQAHEYSLDLLIEDQAKISVDKLKPIARSQGFRLAIVKAYEHRCTTCGIRILTSDGHTIVEAAHIVPFSISRNDDPRNGLCLCRTCHWSFDEGLISVSRKYEVMISPQLNMNPNISSYTLALTERKIIHPIKEKYLPSLDNLSWHHQKIFRVR